MVLITIGVGIYFFFPLLPNCGPLELKVSVPTLARSIDWWSSVRKRSGFRTHTSYLPFNFNSCYTCNFVAAETTHKE